MSKPKPKAKPRPKTGALPPENGNPMEVPKTGKPTPSRKLERKPAGKTRVKPLPDGTDPTEGGKFCGASLRNRPGHFCRLAAGHGTDHVGEGRCSLHGGLTPIRHGRYSSLTTRPRLRELMAQLADDPDPLDLLPELQLMRAVVIEFLERYDEMHDALLAWHQSFDKEFASDWTDWLREIRKHIDVGGEPNDPGVPPMPDPLSYLPRRPSQIVDIAQASSIASQIGQMVDRINKMREDKTFSMATVAGLFEAMSGDLTQVALEKIDDAELRESVLDAVAARWRGIQLRDLGSKRPRFSETPD